MRKNLVKRMIDKDIANVDLAKTIGVTERTIKNKISGNLDFKLSEVLEIRNKHFPKEKIETLFEDFPVVPSDAHKVLFDKTPDQPERR